MEDHVMKINAQHKQPTTDRRGNEVDTGELVPADPEITEKGQALEPLEFVPTFVNGNKSLKIVLKDGPDGMRAKLIATTGTRHPAFGGYILMSTVFASSPEKFNAESANIISEAMIDLQPRDGFEGMLCAQMVAVFRQAMDCLTKANNEQLPYDIAGFYRNQSIKLMRTYTAQLETLKRYRIGGQQRMVVEHVTVNQGGQAIVGNISQSEDKRDG